MVDLSDYDEETIQKAFWLQRKIKRDGLEAIRFMAITRTKLRGSAPKTVTKHLNKNLKRL